MIKTLIIDDEQPAREFLEKLLNRYVPNKFVVVHKVGNIEQGFEQIKLQKPHLVFLDIKMQGGSGFELLKKINSIDFEVIFTTAYSEFALEAIKQSALDYLLKPINHIDLGTAIKKFEKKTKYQNELDRIKKSSIFAKKLGIEVHAGHGLDYKTTKILNKIREIEEFNIGHYIIGESVFFGLSKVIKNFKRIINK